MVQKASEDTLRSLTPPDNVWMPQITLKLNLKKSKKIIFFNFFGFSKQLLATFGWILLIFGYWGHSKSIFSKSKPLIKNQLDRFFYYHLVSLSLKGDVLTTHHEAYFLKIGSLKNACFEHSQSAWQRRSENWLPKGSKIDFQKAV